MAKKIGCILLTIVLCASLVFYDSILALFNTSVNKTLGRDVNSGYGVSSSNELAVKVGMDILENGGNAVDAATAISYVLGVVEPYGSGIGGGGCMLIYLPTSKDYKFYNYREVAPMQKLGLTGDIGVPGFVKGMEEIQAKYGKKEMSDLLQPAIDYAKDGFKMNENLSYRLDVYKGYSDLSKLTQFFDADGNPKAVGSNIVQTDLAETLMDIQKNGSQAFYSGAIADKLETSALLTKEDLESYKVQEQEPIKGTFNGYDVITSPAPFSGITLLQILNMIEYADVPSYKDDPVKYIEEMSKIVNIAYTSRQANISDPNFANSNKDYEKLATPKYAKYLYNKNYTKDSDEAEESIDTTSFVVTDSDGMVVSCTNTLGDFFGSQVSVGGFFLNDASSHFNANDYSINRYEPGKQSRTFIAPAIITKEGKYMMGIGSPGGNVIPQALSQVINWNLREGLTLEEAVDEPRLVFRNSTEVYYEEEIPHNIKKKIEEDGNKYSLIYYDSNIMYGSIHAITKDENLGINGVSDKRRRGYYEVKY